MTENVIIRSEVTRIVVQPGNIAKGEKGDQGPPGPSGATSQAKRRFLVAANAEPSDGEVQREDHPEEGVWTFKLSVVDADGTPTNLSALLPGDNLLWTNDPPDGTAPDQFSRFSVHSSSPISHGGFWEFDAYLLDSSGGDSGVNPPPGTSVLVTVGFSSTIPDQYVLRGGDTMQGILHLSPEAQSQEMTSVQTRQQIEGVANTAASQAAAPKVNRAGDTMTGPLNAYRHPVDFMEVATKQYVDTSGGGGSSSRSGGTDGIGTIKMWPTAGAPIGWALCDGGVHTSQELFDLIGSWNTPDLRDKFVVAAGRDYVVGAQGGEKTHTLTEAEMPSHSHAGRTGGHVDGSNASHGHGFRGAMTGENHPVTNTGNQWGNFVPDAGYERAAPEAVAYTNTDHLHDVTVGAKGGNAAHENRPPYYALTFIIKIAAEVADDLKAAFVDITGDAMVGELLLAGNPDNVLGATPKQYVDAGDTAARAYADEVTMRHWVTGALGDYSASVEGAWETKWTGLVTTPGPGVLRAEVQGMMLSWQTAAYVRIGIYNADGSVDLSRYHYTRHGNPENTQQVVPASHFNEISVAGVATYMIAVQIRQDAAYGPGDRGMAFQLGTARAEFSPRATLASF